MKLPNQGLEELSQHEMTTVSGGGWAFVVAVYAAVLAGAVGYGYYQGKEDCPPPPC